MKLRIRGNSIRIRVSQTELSSIADDGQVEETIQFSPDARLRYGLAVTDDGAPRVSYEGNRILIRLPRAAVQRWLAPDQVGIESAQAIGAGEQLKILVEKDFTCLAPRAGEDDADLFPNPQAD